MSKDALTDRTRYHLHPLIRLAFYLILYFTTGGTAGCKASTCLASTAHPHALQWLPSTVHSIIPSAFRDQAISERIRLICPSTYTLLVGYLHNIRRWALLPHAAGVKPFTSLHSSLPSPSSGDVLGFSIAPAGTCTPQISSSWQILLTAVASRTGNVVAMSEGS